MRSMRDSARVGDVKATMEQVRKLEALSGASLGMHLPLQAIDKKIKTLDVSFWTIGSQSFPGGAWQWDDPVAVFCHQVIALVRAASSSGNVALVEALEGHGVDVGAMGWTQVTGPAIMQRRSDLLRWAIARGADLTGRSASYDITLGIGKFPDMDRAPLVLACERGWRQGVAIMMQGRCAPDDFWARTRPGSGSLIRSAWLPGCAKDPEMAKWLIGRHDGHITTKMLRRIKHETSRRATTARAGSWLRTRDLDEMVDAMVSRQRLREAAPEMEKDGLGQTRVPARPIARM